MKKRVLILVLLLVNCIWLSLIMGFSKNSDAYKLNMSSVDYDYVFDQNYLGNGTLEYKNLKHYDKITGNYNATFTFTNESDYSNPNNWTISDETGGSINIYPTFNQHDKVLELNDTSAVNLLEVYQQHDPQITGRYELWMCSTDVTYTNYVIFHNSLGASDFGMRLYNNIFEYYDGTWNTLGKPAEDNQWYHIVFDFSCITDTYYLYVNDIQYGSFPMRTNINNVNYIRLLTHTTFSNYKLYIDALGYTWDTYYSEDDNIIPLTESIASNLLSNEKYEFNINENGIPLAYNYDNQGKDYSTNLEDWVIVDPGTNDVYVQNGWYLDYNGYDVELDDNGIIIEADDFTPSEGGLKHDTLNINGLYYNLSYSMRFQGIGSAGSTNVLTFYVFALNGSEVIRWRLLEHTTTSGSFYLQFWDGSTWDSKDVLTDCNNPDVLYLFYTYSYYTAGSNKYQFTVRVYKDGVLDSVQSGDLLHNAVGVSEVRLYASSPLGGIWIPRIESIELLNYDISICNERGYLQSYSKEDSWFGDIQNLMVFSGLNYASVYIYGEHDIKGWTYHTISNWTNDAYFNNTIESTWEYENASLFIVNNEYINTSIDASIYGIQLERGASVYYASYTYQGLLANQSYFYLSSTDRLYYTTNFSESGLDFMEIEFNIPNLSCENYSIVFTSNIWGTGYGECRVYHTDDSYSWVDLPNTLGATRFILNQEKTLDKISFVITDNNEFNGTFYGFITSVSLEYFVNVAFSITTMTLMEVLIPLLLILFPSVFIGYRLGKKSFKVVFPIMFIMMSIVAFATDLIPLWMLIIILVLTTIVFLTYSKYERDSL